MATRVFAWDANPSIDPLLYKISVVRAEGMAKDGEAQYYGVRISGIWGWRRDWLPSICSTMACSTTSRATCVKSRFWPERFAMTT